MSEDMMPPDWNPDDPENVGLVELREIERGLKDAKEYGLEAQFVWTMINALRSNPQIPLNDLLFHAYCEWDL